MGYIGYRAERAAVNGFIGLFTVLPIIVLRGGWWALKIMALIFLWPVRVIITMVRGGRATTLANGASGSRQPADATDPAAWARAHKKPLAWGIGGFFAVGGFGTLTSGDFGSAALAVVIVAVCAGLLVKWRRADQAADAAQVSARAEYEHQMYLQDNPIGTYGQYQPPHEVQSTDEAGRA
ncbi:hypothetical protein G4X40_21440 [Rhodococcus sp. D2-41]|uniref:hypothetical protein n=1 Tax=Speluncibacter jeojiensis TaxID=2710754 RepID=UPI002410210D|nr:hypothetical protein [Rhodococcus sp. D2-41]MDG3012707.1 hypothetical protein [Rhodococcus sp. D2-41]